MILNALDEVLYWDEIKLLKQTMSGIIKRHYPHDKDGFYREKNRFLCETIPDRGEFLRRFGIYEKNGGTIWVGGRNPCCDDITPADLIKAVTVSSKTENGKRKSEMSLAGYEQDPEFWGYYTSGILHTDKNTVCELTVGAGGGTSKLMREMRADDLYIGVDIDFVCAKNADAIARYLGINGLGLASSLWNLPFEDGIFSSVCSNMGLEECREVPAIIAQAARILSVGGRFVLHCSRVCKLWASYFEKYGFTEQEARIWLRRVRLYADWEQIVAMSEDYGMELIGQRFDERKGYVLIFRKRG